jgi:5-methylcytosine-specific restriction endonuclease McrA
MLHRENMAMRKLNIDWPTVLQQEYVVEHHGSNYIGKKHGCDSLTVRTHLRLLGFKIRTIAESLEGQSPSQDTRRKLSESMRGKSPKWLLGRKLSQDVKDKMSKSHKGRKNTQEHNANISRAQRQIERHYSLELRKKMSLSMKGRFAGEKHPNWQGGKTPKGILLRNSAEYNDWRLAVFTKDGFTCIGCGDKRGHNLQAHHILSFAKYPELRLDVSNGVTLCNNCHSKVHPDLKFIIQTA